MDSSTAEVGRGTPAPLNIGELFEDVARAAINHGVSHPGCQRSEWTSPAGARFVLDRFDAGAECLFARFPLTRKEQNQWCLGAGYRFMQCPMGGWLLMPEQSDRDAYWLPQPPVSRKVDPHGRILAEQPAKVAAFSSGPEGCSAIFEAALDGHLDVVAWRFPQRTPSFKAELTERLPIEAQGIFLWGSHARIDCVADVFRHVIHGAVYDVRFAWPYNRKCCSENEAHAIYVALAGLEKATGKRMYRVLQQQLVTCLLARQADDGGWYHGLWTQAMDCHFRLHASGVHLLLDEYERCRSDSLRSALSRAVAFLSRQTDQIDAGTWLLHDSLEKTPEALSDGPFKWVKSHALGKSATNMLVLNTHLDSTIAIDRYIAATRDTSYEALVLSARKATARVLSLRTAEWLYRPLFAAVGLTLLPTATARRLPLPKRALKRIAWRFLIPRLPAIKSRLPRLRMPNGYIDRELSLKTWAFDYHSINIMDLLRYHRRFDDHQSVDAALDGIRFAQTSALPDRLAEVQGKEYALGFWAESLYHWCTLTSESSARQALAEAILKLVDEGLGLPPSLLGANGEAVANADQVPCPIASDPRLRVGNLSRRHASEMLVVNPTAETIRLTWLRSGDAVEGLGWISSEGQAQTSTALSVPARGFLIGSTKAT
jgi:hypothetical protein